jgi:hypothetical protein
MTRIAAKLLILLALLAMPLGMASASAGEQAHHQPANHESMGHCADKEPAKADLEPGIAACTMACAAALPAAGPFAAVRPALAAAPLPALPMKALVGVLLEIATPPPRAA